MQAGVAVRAFGEGQPGAVYAAGAARCDGAGVRRARVLRKLGASHPKSHGAPGGALAPDPRAKELGPPGAHVRVSHGYRTCSPGRLLCAPAGLEARLSQPRARGTAPAGFDARSAVRSEKALASPTATSPKMVVE